MFEREGVPEATNHRSEPSPIPEFLEKRHDFQYEGTLSKVETVGLGKTIDADEEER